MQKRFVGGFSSSANPEKLARTWQGIFGTISVLAGTIVTFITLPLVGSVMSMLGLSDNLSQLAAGITDIVTTLGMFGTASLGVYGIIYKTFVAVHDKWLSKIPWLQ